MSEQEEKEANDLDSVGWRKPEVYKSASDKIKEWTVHMGDVGPQPAADTGEEWTRHTEIGPQNRMLGIICGGDTEVVLDAHNASLVSLRGQLRQEKEQHEFYRRKVSDFMGANQQNAELIASLRAEKQEQYRNLHSIAVEKDRLWSEACNERNSLRAENVRLKEQLTSILQSCTNYGQLKFALETFLAQTEVKEPGDVLP
jgi:xanthine/CO dehydrogenase XdhC/CoxF family maturation factor